MFDAAPLLRAALGGLTLTATLAVLTCSRAWCAAT